MVVRSISINAGRRIMANLFRCNGFCVCVDTIQLLWRSQLLWSLGDKDNSNQRLHRACTGGPLHVQTSVVHRTWHHCCFSSSPRLSFGTGVDRCDDSVGHHRGCHLDALGTQRWWQSKLIWFVTYPVSSIIAFCDWQRGQPDSALQLLVLYAHDDVNIYLIYTLWKRIESFNEYYRIFVLNVVVTILSS